MKRSFFVAIYFAFCLETATFGESNDKNIDGNDIHGNDDIHSNEINGINPLPRPKFRLLKYQEVWDLVLKRLKDVDKLQELSKKLLKLDRAELEFKRKKESGDPTYYPEAEQAVVEMLPTVLKRFNVLDHMSDWRPKETHFDDIRLQNSWQKVVAEGEFNGGELKSLHAEFHEMQKRLHDYVSLTRRIEEFAKQLNNETANEASHMTSNFVDDDHEVKEGEEHGLSDALKLSHMRKRMLDEFDNIDEDVMVLTEKVKERIAETRRSDVFTDSRVKELWEKAEGIFIDKDLEIFKSELNQFQNRISKLHHWEKMTKKLRLQLDETGFEKELREEYMFAKEKVKELQRLVKKYHSTLFNRVYSTFKEEL